MLFSHIVQDIQEHCKMSGTAAYMYTCAYYYCYFGRNQDETEPFLRWTINQLCRQCGSIPDEIIENYDDGVQPSRRSLLQALSALLTRFERIYVLIDALDESFPRMNLLNLLVLLSGEGFKKIQLCGMSREEEDIKFQIQGHCTSISLSNPYIDEDIDFYVQHRLERHHRLKTWSLPFKETIRQALVEGAKGMYVYRMEHEVIHS